MPWLPVSKQDVRVDERRLDETGERFALLGGHLGAQVRDHHVVASEHTRLPEYALCPPCAHIGYGETLRRVGGAIVLDPNGGALESQANGSCSLVEPTVIEPR